MVRGETGPCCPVGFCAWLKASPATFRSKQFEAHIVHEEQSMNVNGKFIPPLRCHETVLESPHWSVGDVPR